MIVENIEDKALLTAEINDNIGTDKEIIGTFVKNTAKLSIRNLNHQYDNLKDKYISISNFGSWYVYDLINNEDATEAQLSLYDISNKFDEEYNAELYSFPCTFEEWATKIGEVVGVPLEGTFLNYNLEIKEAPFLGTNPSNRDAVKFIAKYASGYAQINSNDTYSIKWFDKTIYEIEDWESFAHGNESKEVNTVVLSTGDTGDNECWPQSKPEDPHEIKIVDDWTNIDRTTIIEDIYNQLRGFKYTPITKLEVPYGLLELRAGQMIKAQDIELKYITTYISGHKLTWDGGDFDDPNSWSSSIKMMEISETSSKYTYSGSVINRLTRTERTVDKQNQIIKDVVESTDEAVSKVNEFEMSLDGIKLSVDETNKKFDKEIVTKKNTNGNPIEVSDAGEYPLESIAIDGKSYQKTTTGKNLFPTLLQGTAVKGNITFTHHEEDDSYDIVGTASTTAYLSQIALRMTIEDSKIENGKYYTMSFNQAIPNDDMIIVAELYGSSGYLRGIVNSNYPCMQANLSNATVANFYIYVKPGKTVNIKRLKIQLEEGTVATPIEPYTGAISSPNSKYPQEIETVQGITNYFDIKKWQNLGSKIYGNGCSVQVDENSIVLHNPTKSDAYTTNAVEDRPLLGFELKAGVKYKFIFDNPNLCRNQSWMVFFNENYEFVSNAHTEINNLEHSSLSFTMPEGCKYAYPRFDNEGYGYNVTELIITNIAVIDEKYDRYVPYGRWLEQITIGKNLFNGRLELGNIDNGINLTATNTYRSKDYIKIKPNTNYSFSINSKSQRVIISFYDSDKNFINTGNSVGTITDGIFTTPTNAEYLRFRCYGDDKNLFGTGKIQLQKGSLTPYEEYKENTTLIDMNKDNLFDSEIEVGALSGNNGTSVQSIIRLRSKNHIKLTPYLRYSLKYDEDNIKYNIFYYDKNKTYISNFGSWLTNKDTFIVPSNAEYVRFVFHNSSYPNNNMQVSDISNIQLYEGYEPYYEFAEVEDTRDSFLDGSLIKKINKYICTGDETTWKYWNHYYYMPLIYPKTTNTRNALLSTHFIWNSTQKDIEGTGFIANGNIYLYPNDTSIIDVASWKTFLKEEVNKGTPVKIYYESTSPQIYELPYERLKLHKGYNYITLNDELYPNMEIEYLTDSVLNATYATHAELKIESEKISSEVAKKVSSNDLNEVIEDVNSTIEQKAESITSEINGKFANYSTTSQMNASIKSQVNEKGASIIDQVNGKFTNYSTTTEMNSKIEKKIDDNNAIIKLEVSKVDEKVDNIQVGGTNLILDSEREITVPLGTGIQSNRISVTPGEQIAFSFDVKGASAYTGNIALIECWTDATTSNRYDYKWITGAVKTTYDRIKYLYTVPANVYYLDLGLRSSSNVVNTYKRRKAERGNMFTDWDAAPEDKLGTAKFTKAEIIAEINEGISNVKIYAENIKLEGTVTANGTFVIDKDGSMKATAGIIGGWEIFEDHLSADTIIGNNLYRTYLQPVLKDHEKDTWVFSIQKGAKGATNLDGIFNVLSNGDIETVGNIHATGVMSNSGGFQTDNDTYNDYGIISPNWVETGSVNNTIDSGANLIILSITLPKGFWTIQIRSWFGANSSGIRGVGLTTGNNTFAQGNDRFIVVPGCAYTGIAQSIIYSLNIKVTTQTTYNLVLFQNSGKSLSCGAYIRGFRLK